MLLSQQPFRESSGSLRPGITATTTVSNNPFISQKKGIGVEHSSSPQSLSLSSSNCLQVGPEETDGSGGAVGSSPLVGRFVGLIVCLTGEGVRRTVGDGVVGLDVAELKEGTSVGLLSDAIETLVLVLDEGEIDGIPAESDNSPSAPSADDTTDGNVDEPDVNITVGTIMATPMRRVIPTIRALFTMV